MISIAANDVSPHDHLVDATWVLPNREAPLDGYLIGTGHTIDTDRIKLMEPSERAEGSATVFGDAGLAGSGRIAVYDRAGLFSAPWIWWLLRSHGCNAVLVEGWGETVASINESDAATFASSGQARTFNATKQDVLDALGTEVQIIDARPAGRFQGLSPEPRPDCRAGHIPGSLNVPFGKLKADRSILSAGDLKVIFEDASVDLNKPIITTCGSGVTASGLAFALTRCGAEDVRVYQGSWAEWGVDQDLPIETGS